ncbi:MAG TPA: MFS transporter [Gemmatimonadaceae bacterium]|nr:MFS transporter [Gemmatimonadaceae bacterium]
MTKPSLVNGALMRVFVSSFGATMSFYLLLSVVPLYATSVGAGGIGAGMTTGALMFATVATELATPRLVARFGYQLVFAAGLFLLGAPALALPASASMLAILIVCLVRGVGFAISVVVGSSLVASFVPPERRGEGLGLYGVIVQIPAIVGLPLGVWLSGHAGFPTVFVLAAAAGLAGLLALPGLPRRTVVHVESVGILEGLRSPALLRPALAFSATAMAAGVVVTFLPLAVTRNAGNVAALALFAQAVAATVTRWWAGRHGDRHGSAKLLIPALLVSAAGLFAEAMLGSPIAVVLVMVVFGAGFGVAQNASLILMFERVQPSGYDTASALWNLAYDAGLGVGGAGFGVLVAQTGYSAAFACTAVLMLVALVPALRDRARAVSGWA